MPFKIVRNDLTKMKVDAIVNTANPYPVIGDGTDHAVYEAAGKDELLKARNKIGRIGRGQAAITPAFNLKARYIIHAVGPVWTDGKQGEDVILRSCYENSLKLARKYRCSSIAFPLISTGTYGFPKALALEIVNGVVREFLEKERRDLMVYLVLFDGESVRLSGEISRNLDQYIDDHYVEKRQKEEYTGSIRNDLLERDRRRAYEAYSFPEESLSEESLEWKEEIEYPEASMPDMPDSLRPVSYSPAKPSGLSRKKRSLDDVLNNPEETFQVMLFRLIKEKGMTNPQVYKKANMDKKLFSKIKKDINYHPKKNTVLALAFALELNLDQTRDLLARAGFALSPSSRFDLAITFFLENRIYDMFTVEETLFLHDLGTLCSY